MLPPRSAVSVSFIVEPSSLVHWLGESFPCLPLKSFSVLTLLLVKSAFLQLQKEEMEL